MVILNQINKCYEHNIKYQRPRNGLVSKVETPAITLAQSLEPSLAVEYFLPSDVLPQVEATVGSMLITKPAFPLLTIPAEAELPLGKAVPPKCEMPAYGDIGRSSHYNGVHVQVRPQSDIRQLWL